MRLPRWRLQPSGTFSGCGEEGATTTEYAIMMVLIALAVVTAGGTTGIDEAVVGVFSFVQSLLS